MARPDSATAAPSLPRWVARRCARRRFPLAGARHHRRPGAERCGPQRPVEPRPAGRALRGRVRAAHRRGALPGHRQRHQRAAHDARRPGRRPGRRGDRPALHLRRHGQRGAAPARAAGVRRHRRRDIPDRRAQGRRGDHGSHAGRHARAPRRRGRRSRHDSCRRRGHAACRWSKMRARHTWPSGRGARSARMAGQAASASRPARTSTAPKAARFSPTTPSCWKPATGSTTTAAAGPPPAAPISRIAASAPTCGSPIFRRRMLLAQMTRLEQQARTRDANGAYLTSLLSGIPGIAPARTVRRLHAQRVPPLHVPLRQRALSAA